MTDLARVDLPLAPHLEAITVSLQRERVLILEAEPGAGKSTLVPPYLLDQVWVRGGRILMLEPRRVAAAAVASRIADLLGESVGQRAGYRVRSDTRVGPRTRIEVMTEALLTRRIQADPLLEDVAVVIFDEIHERSVHVDLALALALEVRRARPELALLAMSATPPAQRLTQVLGAPVHRVPGRAHEVRTRYVDPGGRGARDWTAVFARELSRLTAETDGSVLAFLPGRPEIGRVRRALAEHDLGDRVVLELHGGLSLEEQRRIIAPVADERPRLILSTSIAETSLTVPGVRVIADSGWARTSHYHAPSGMDRLVTTRVSRSSADQRRGRAGRLGPGICVRFWSESEPLLAEPTPEILRSDLSALVLEARIWGATGPASLTWLDTPPEAAWKRATALLQALGHMDAEGRPTPAGVDAAGMGLPPRLAALVRHGRATGRAGLAAVMAAMLEERDGSGMGDAPDFRARLAAYRAGAGSRAWRAAVGREAARIARASGGAPRGGAVAAAWRREEEDAAGELLARGFPDRIGRLQAGGDWRFPTGRVARLRQGPGLAPPPGGEELGWCVAPVVDAGEDMGVIRVAAAITARTALEALEPVIGTQVVVRWSALKPRVVHRRYAGRIPLDERPGPVEGGVVREAFFARLCAEGIGILPWTATLRRKLDRLRAFARSGGAVTLPGGDLGDTALARQARSWLEGWLVSDGGPVLTRDRLGAALDALVARRGDLERLAPETLTLPSGTRRRIDYSAGEPALEVRIQELFGLASTPRVAGRPVLLRLLSPAGRPLQITRDLESFWRNTYPEVRKEMRGRYPKHPWPEDPLSAVPPRKRRQR